MANLRKKYYSVSLSAFTDVNTNQNFLMNTQDINNGPNDLQKIRLISFKEDIDTARFTQVISDLIYNDVQILAAAEQAVEVLSDGVFRDVNQEFSISNVENTTWNAQLWPTTIKINGGQERKNHIVLRKDINSFTVAGDISNGINVISNINTINLVPFLVLNNPNLPPNTYIVSVGVNSITLNNNAIGSALASNIVFSDEKIFKIGNNIPDFTLTGVFPKYRRVMIELDASTGVYNLVSGPEQSKRLPINTQLDVTNANSLGLYSLLLYKNSSSDPTIIYEIDQIWEYVGLISGTIGITRAELDKGFDGTFSIHTQQFEHLRDSSGNLLDWAEGQSIVSRPFIGDSYTNLHVIEETQLPQSYDTLNSSSPVIIPTVVRNENVNDNYSASSTVSIKKVELGVKNSPAFIGDEGIAVQMVTADTVFDFTSNETAKNGSPSLTQLFDNAHDFTLPINAYTVQVNDFVLILDNGIPPGKGDFQIAKITAITTNTLTLSGLTKPISNGAKYNIFKNSTEVTVGSEAFIDNVSLRSQVLSGINGRFGNNNSHSIVAIEYSSPVTINVDKYYFIKVRGYNINPPVWGILPWITIDKPQPTPTDNGKRNAYFELYYNSFAGNYPDGNFLIEDEFGDINVDQEQRTFAPHFKPKKYYLIARALDYIPNNIETNMNDDDVFVDVHTGKIKFKTGFEPRRVFVTYFKKDEINGDSLSAEIKYKNVRNSDQINVQDKLTELDNRFIKGTDIEEPSTTNGIKSFEEKIFRGSYAFDKRFPNNISLADTSSFDFYSADDKKLIQFTGNYSDEIVDSDKFSATVKHKVLKDSELAVRKTSLGKLDFASNKFPMVGLNSADDQFILSEDSLSKKNPISIKKFNDSALENSGFDHNKNIAFYDLSNSIDGSLNNIHIRGFDKNSVLRALLRKKSTETLNYPMSALSRRNLKQRDAITLLDNDLTKIENDNQVISEHFFSDVNLTFNELSTYKKNFVSPYLESTNYYKYRFVTGTIADQIVQSSNITKYSVAFNEDIKKIVIAYADPTATPNANELRVKIYDVARGTTEYKEFETITISNDYTNQTAFEIVKVKTVLIDNDRFAIVYILNDSLFKIHLKIYSYTTGLIYTTTSPISFEGVTDLGVHNDAFLDALCFDENFIVVAWKKSGTESSYRIFYLEDNSVSSEVVFSNDAIYENFEIIPFSFDSFLIAYSYSGSFRIKQYNYDTNLVLFGANDYLEISNNLIANGFFFKSTELQNNNVAFIYSETDGLNIEVYLKIFDEYSRTLSAAQKISLSPVPSGNRHKNFSIIVLDNNCFLVSYIDENAKVNVRVFQNNGDECFDRLVDTSILKTSLSSIRLSDRSFINLYSLNLTDFYIEFVEFRPNVEKYISYTSSEYQFSTLDAKGISSCVVSPNMTVVAFVENGVNKNGWIAFIDPQKFDLSSSTGYSLFKFHDAALNGDLDPHTKIISIKYSSPTNVNVVAIAYTKTGGDSEIAWVDISTTTPTIIGTTTVSTNVNAYPSLIKLSNTRATVVYGIASFGYAAEISLTPLNTNSVPTIGPNQAFSNATTKYPFVFQIDSTTLGITYDNNSTNGLLTLLDVTTSTYSILNSTPFIFYSTQIADISKAVLTYPNTVIIAYRDFTTNYLLMSLIDVTAKNNPTFLSSFSNPYIVENSIVSNIDLVDHDDDIEENKYVLITYKKTTNYNAKIVNFTDTSAVTLLGSEFNIASSVTSDCHAIKFHRNNILSFYGKTNSMTRRFESLFLRMEDDKSIVYNIGSLTDQFKAYTSDTIKILGVDYSGKLTRPIEISRSKLSDIPVAENLIDSEGNYLNSIMSSSIGVVYFSPKIIGVVYHKFDFKANNQVAMRLFRVYKNRFFSYSSEILLGTNFTWTANDPKNIYLYAQNLNDDTCLVVYKNPSDGLIKKAVIDKTGNTLFNSYSDITITNPSLTPSYKVIGTKSLRNGYIFVLIYDSFDSSFRTTIISNDGLSEIHQSTKFLISDFIGSVGMPSIDNFGNVTYYFKDLVDNFFTYQHGIDGNFAATICLVGENELNNFRVSKEATMDKEVVPFYQFRRVADEANFLGGLEDVGDFKFKLNIRDASTQWPFYRLTQQTQDISETQWPELVPFLRSLALQDNDGNDYELNIINYHTPDQSSIILELDPSDSTTNLVLAALEEDRKYNGYALSLTSNSIGTGNKTFTLTSNLTTFKANDKVIIKHDSTNYMIGSVVSYNESTLDLVVNVTSIVGAGSYSGDWQITRTSNWKSLVITQGFFYLPAYEAFIFDFDLTNATITIQKNEQAPSNVVTLLNMDGVPASTTILDTSLNPKTWTAFGSAQLGVAAPISNAGSTDETVQGKTALAANIAGSYIKSLDHPDWDFNTGDFTISSYIYQLSASSTSNIITRTSDITDLTKRKYAIRVNYLDSNKNVHWLGNYGGIDIQTPTEVLATTTVGSAPLNICDGFGSIWTADQGANTVTRVDKTTMTVLATITLAGGTTPNDIVAFGNYIYVACASGDVERIDPLTNTSVSWSSTVGFALYGFVNFNNQELWVLQTASPYQLRKVNTSIGGFLGSVNLPTQSLAGTSDANYIYLSSVSSDDIYKIDTTTISIVDTWNGLIGGINNYGILDDGDYLWASSFNAATIVKIRKSDKAVISSVTYAGHNVYYLTKNDKFVFGSTYITNSSIVLVDKNTGKKAGSLDDNTEYGSSSNITGVLHDGTNLFISCYGTAKLKKLIGKGYIRREGWTKIDVVRHGTNLYIYIDGDRVASGTDTTNYDHVADLFVGAESDVSSFNGYIDQTIVIKGFAKYTVVSYYENKIGKVKFYPFRIADDTTVARAFQMKAATVVSAGLNSIASLSRRDHILEHDHEPHTHNVLNQSQYGTVPVPNFFFPAVADSGSGYSTDAQFVGSMIDFETKAASLARKGNYLEPRHQGVHVYIFGKKYVSR